LRSGPLNSGAEQVQESWANINGRGHWNHEHAHGTTAFAGCYYVDTGLADDGGGGTVVVAAAVNHTGLLLMDPRPGGTSSAVSRAFPSWKRSILTEIYPCHACSYLRSRMETPGQGLSALEMFPLAPSRPTLLTPPERDRSGSGGGGGAEHDHGVAEAVAQVVGGPSRREFTTPALGRAGTLALWPGELAHAVSGVVQWPSPIQLIRWHPQRSARAWGVA
jgi:hypothetical protein